MFIIHMEWQAYRLGSDGGYWRVNDRCSRFKHCMGPFNNDEDATDYLNSNGWRRSILEQAHTRFEGLAEEEQASQKDSGMPKYTHKKWFARIFELHQV